MKPPPFEYEAPQTLDEALAALREHGDEAKVLAGGQSLVPLMNFRLARPEWLVDVNDVRELDYLHADGGTVRIGALTRHAALERSGGVAERVPLLRDAVRYVGHVQIRNRGTVGGSVAHADPAAELPAALVALDARFHVRSAYGARVIDAAELFAGYLQTTLEPDELLCEIEVPAPPAGTRHAFVEYSRRHGDFALGGVAALVRCDDDGVCEQAALALLGAGSTPLRPSEAEEWLVGVELDAQSAAEAASRAVADLSPLADVHGSGEYRRELLAALVRRALVAAGAVVGDAA